MPLLRINATEDGIALHDAPYADLEQLADLSKIPGPAIIMVHGYKYAPGLKSHCPHKKIFGLHGRGWPRALGFEDNRVTEGLGIALGWHARGSLHSMYARAGLLGKRLAQVVRTLRKTNPTRPVHIVAHSLGSHAALRALGCLPERAVDRMILLSGASYTSLATQMLASPAGRSVEILNVTSRENDLFDAVFERLVPSSVKADQAIGRGIAMPNVATLQLDCRESLGRLHRMGFIVGDPARRICHWSSYTRPGVMALYKTFLRDPEALPLDALIRLLPQKTAPRWSRLIAVPSGARTKPGIRLPARDLPRRTVHYFKGLNVIRRPQNEPAY